MRPAPMLGLTFIATTLIVAIPSFARTDESVSVGDNRIGIGTKPILLLTRVDVQLDLKLSPQQAKDAQQVISSLRRRAFEARQKDARLLEAERRQIDHDMTQWLKTHLSVDQSNRLHQIDLQWEGIAAIIHRPIVTEYMNVTEAQKKALAALINEHLKARAAQPPTFDSHAALTRQGLAQLSEAQQAQWQQLLGATCRFTISGPTATALAQPIAGPGPISR